MNESFKSVLTLDGIAFEEMQYSRKLYDMSVMPEYEMNFERTVTENDDKVHYIVSLAANIRSKDNSITLRVKLTGFFACDCDDEKTKRILINDNTVAILFPYLRSQITLVSTQPGLPSIIVPPVNIAAIFKDAEKNNS